MFFWRWRIPVLLVLAIGVLVTANAWQRENGDRIGSQGIFEWFQKPAAVRFKGQYDRTYVTWISHDGQVVLRAFDHGQNAWLPPVNIFDAKKTFGEDAIDDHNGPSVLMLPDGTLLVFTAIHDVHDAIGVQRMGTPEDMNSWTPWTPIFTGTDAEYDYPQAKRLPSGDIALFLRRGNWRQSAEIMTTSADAGRSWGAPTTLISFGASFGVYALVSQKENRLDLAWSTRPNGGRPKGLYYMSSDDGGTSWHQSNRSLQVLPARAENAEAIVTNDEALYIWDVVISSDGVPAMTYVQSEAGRTWYGYASVQDGAWRAEHIIDTTLLYGATHFYAGGIVIDPRDIQRVVLSAQRSTKEIEIWSKNNQGWKRRQQITRNSGRDNFRPQYVQNDPTGRVVWSAGQYDGFVDNNWSGFSRVDIRTARSE